MIIPLAQGAAAGLGPALNHQQALPLQSSPLRSHSTAHRLQHPHRRRRFVQHVEVNARHAGRN
jgi:hypothetical protein